MSQYPEYIKRKDDGELLKINRQDLTYSFVDCKMGTPYKYTFGLLMYDPRYKDHFEVVK